MTSSATNGRRKGKAGEKAVRRLLKKYAAKHPGIKILNGIYLPLYKGCCEIDHLLLGTFGIAVLETKSIGGRLSGSPAAPYLLHQLGKQTHRLYNPLLQNKTHCDNVRHHLNKAGFKHIPIYPLTIYTDETLFLENQGLGIKLSSFEKTLDKLPGARCDAVLLHRTLRSVRVRNPWKKWLHTLLIRSKKN